MHITEINTANLAQTVNALSAEIPTLAFSGELTPALLDTRLDGLLATVEAMAAAEKLDAYETYTETAPLLRALRSAAGRRNSRRNYVFSTWRRLLPLLKTKVT